MNRKTSTEDGYFPIRTVCSLTGINPVTLRAWERRYGLIQPRRTPTGHRLYSHEDIDRINEVLALLAQGVAISQVSAMLKRRVPKPEDAEDGPWADFRRRMIGAVQRFDEAALEEAYSGALSLYPAALVADKLVLPVLRDLGKAWEQGNGGVAEEHFFGVYLRNKLGARFHHGLRLGTGPRILACCMPGEGHEVGLLLFGLAAQARGFRVVLLGANMPLEELPLAVRRANCEAIVLSASIDPPPLVWKAQLPVLVEASPVPVCVGGGVSVRRRDSVEKAGAVPLGEDVNAALRHLAALLDPATGDISGV
jgi:MerR family transcriptional regulator, light-induced transcriptional regulator